MKGRVLVVEDDVNVRAAISMILLNAGYSVQEAGTVAQALMHLDIIDLVGVVLDLRLPNGLGLKVAETLKTKRDDVPVVVMSAYIKDGRDFEAEHGPMEWPIVAALAKPINRGALLAAMRVSVEHAVEINNLKQSTRRLHELTKGGS